MPIPTLDACSYTGTTTDKTTYNLEHNCNATKNSLLVYHGGVEHTPAATFATNITWNGVALTPAGSSSRDSGKGNSSEVWYLLNPDTGTQTLSVTFGDADPEDLIFGISTWEYVKQQAPIEVSSNAIDPPSPYEISTQISPGNFDLIVDYCNFGINLNHGIGNRQTELFNQWVPTFDATSTYAIGSGSTRGMYHSGHADPLRMSHTVAVFSAIPSGIVGVSSQGCYASSTTTASLSSQMFVGESGTAWMVWGTDDKYYTFEGWDGSGQVAGVQNSGATEVITLDITDLTPNTEYTFRTFVSSMLYANVGHWSSPVTFYTPDNPPEVCNRDLVISGNGCWMCCWCSRWDNNNYSTIIETVTTKDELDELRSSITPGAVGELYTILGKPTYYDKTWDGSNTIKLIPNTAKQLGRMRTDKVMFVKNINTSPLEGPDGYISMKIEGLTSGSGDL